MDYKLREATTDNELNGRSKWNSEGKTFRQGRYRRQRRKVEAMPGTNTQSDTMEKQLPMICYKINNS